jgi:hypothetical protein
MAGRQRPFIEMLSLEIQMRTTSGMENGSSETDALCGESESAGLDSV